MSKLRLLGGSHHGEIIETDDRIGRVKVPVYAKAGLAVTGGNVVDEVDAPAWEEYVVERLVVGGMPIYYGRLIFLDAAKAVESLFYPDET